MDWLKCLHIWVDDPFWEAVNLQYWPTADIEWYDPGQATTQGGSLVLNMIEVSSFIIFTFSIC